MKKIGFYFTMYWIYRIIGVSGALIYEERFDDFYLVWLGFISELLYGWMFLPFHLILFFVFMSRFRRSHKKFVHFPSIIVFLLTIGISQLLCSSELSFFCLTERSYWYCYIVPGIIFLTILTIVDLNFNVKKIMLWFTYW